MANNYNKTWIQPAQNALAVARAGQVIRSTGRALPCRVVAVAGSWVTVAFELETATPLPQITIPKAESRWIRVPTQIGDFGITIAADAYLSGIDGSNGGTANLTQPGNLSALVFVPCASKAFPAVNTNAAFISGPQGVVAQTEDGTSSLVINENGIVLSFGGHSITINSSGIAISGEVTGDSTATFTGEVEGNGIKLSVLKVTGVQTGSGVSGPPQAGS